MNNSLIIKIFFVAAGFSLLLISVVLFFTPSQPAVTPSIPPTPTTTQVNPTTAPELQGQADYNYAQAQNAFYKAYPWYDQIPPKNSNYFIGFDSSTKSFFVELYPKATSSSSLQDQTAQLKNSVLQALQSIGVNTSSYKIDWTIVPQ
jgi:hypothetical protein